YTPPRTPVKESLGELVRADSLPFASAPPSPPWRDCVGAGPSGPSPARGKGQYLTGDLGALVALDPATLSLIIRVILCHLLTLLRCKDSGHARASQGGMAMVWSRICNWMCPVPWPSSSLRGLRPCALRRGGGAWRAASRASQTGERLGGGFWWCGVGDRV